MHTAVVTTLALILATMAPAASASPDPSAEVFAGLNPPRSDKPPSDIPTLARDEATVEAIYARVKTSGVTSIGADVATLTAILDRAPADYHPYVVVGDRTFVRGEISGGALVAAVTPRLIGGGSGSAGKPAAPTSINIVTLADPYPRAATLLGSYLDEVGRVSDAVAVLERGYRLRKDFLVLDIELSAALAVDHRAQESLDVAKAAMDSTDKTTPGPLRASLLRHEGFALTELGRIDEAEAAYRKSLSLEPGNPAAEHELGYLARLRAGQGPTQGYIQKKDTAPSPAPPAPAPAAPAPQR